MKHIINEIAECFEQKNSKLLYPSLIKLLKTNNEFIFQKHPLGFKFLNLGSISESQDLRLHFWDSILDTPQDEDLQIHNHSFDFESVVLIGKIRNEIFQLTENEYSNSRLYEVKFVDNKSFLEKQKGNFEINIKTSEEIDEGNFYFLNRNEFHQSNVILNNAITLIKMIKPTVFKSPMLFTRKSVKEHLTFSRSKVFSQNSSDTIIRIINLCQEKLIHNK